MWICPLWALGYQTVWLLTLQIGNTSSSTTEVALVLEDPNRLYYLLWEVLTAAKIRNTPADAHDTNRRRSSHVLECRIEGREPDHYPNQPSVCVAHTCHLSSTQSIIGALLVSPGLFSCSTLIFEVSKSVRLTSLTEESKLLLQEANLIRGLAALTSFSGKITWVKVGHNWEGFIINIPIFFHPLFAAILTDRNKLPIPVHWCTNLFMWQIMCVGSTYICTNCGHTQIDNFRGCFGYPSCLIGPGVPHCVDLVSL